jgi:small subunit ribosomal protein S1
VGSRHKVLCVTSTLLCIRCELEEGVDGLIYISDLSWTQKIEAPSEFCAVGDVPE